MLPRVTLFRSCLFFLALGPMSAGQSVGRADAGAGASARVELEAPMVLEGIVVDRDVAPAKDVVVTSSAGGMAVTDGSGSYRLVVRVPVGAERVELTAVGGGDLPLIAKATIPLIAGSSFTRVAPLELASAGANPPRWLPTFGAQPGVSGVNARADSFAVYDDGGGPALYLGGAFDFGGSAAANNIVKWDGAVWSPLGAGLGGQVLALQVFDDGSGAALYACGSFQSGGGVEIHVARWDGSNWTSVDANCLEAYDITVFDDGAGPALYTAGFFTDPLGSLTPGVGKWNGVSWDLLGTGMDCCVTELGTFDDGTGPGLYAGGEFKNAGGVAVNNIAKWDGTSWSALSSGLSAIFGATSVLAFEVYDDGSGPALHVAGNFNTAGGVTANYIAKWDGASWSSVGAGTSNVVAALTVFDDGTGPVLYAGGFFLTAGGTTVSRIARWDGQTWSPLGNGVGGRQGIGSNSIAALAVFDRGNGPELFAGGAFSRAGDVVAHAVATWDGATWAALDRGCDAPVVGSTVFDDGDCPALYTGGSFQTNGGVLTSEVARWDGADWGALGGGISGTSTSQVLALAEFDDGTGPALYVGGNFSSAGSVAASNIARWDGSTWTDVGGGTAGFSGVFAFKVFDDGRGPALYAAGGFSSAGGVASRGVAKWDGSAWSAVGGGVAGSVSALEVFDDGSGEALFVGGSFSAAGTTSIRSIAKWNGSSWSALGTGVSSFSDIRALAVFDDGDGPALFVGGSFLNPAGVPPNGVAKWNGSAWQAVGGGVGVFNSLVGSLAVFDDGGGPALYAGGVFAVAGGTAANNVAKWDGSTWSALGSGTNDFVETLSVFRDRTGSALYAGGSFESVPDSGDSYLAKWGRPDTNPPTILCPASIVVDDRRGNGRGEVLTFIVTAEDAEDPTPSLVCVPPSGSLFPPGTTTVTCTATDFSGNQSTCQFNVSVRSKLHQP
jgi:hypothetical protein